MGNTIEIRLPYQKDILRIEFFGNQIEGMQWVSQLNNAVTMELDNAIVFPAKHFVTTQEKKDCAIKSIQSELRSWLPQLQNPVYQERIERRVSHDIEMLQEIGHCPGIENYSAHFEGRASGEPPFSLLDFFSDDFLLLVDESHITIPQLRGMYAGDKARKKSLIEFGFRLPSAADNRPLQFGEIEKFFKDVIFVSATPGAYELEHSNSVVEQVIRPTGLLDPDVAVRSRQGQMDDLIKEIKKTSDLGYRSLVMVMTKRLAEEMADFLQDRGIKVCYLHSDLKTPERTDLLQKLRLGTFDCLVGVNLLREGIDLPEVAFVAIMDADLESFLRDKRSLIQIIGRAARNTHAHVVLYADTITQSMRAAMDETARRRALQDAYNKHHGITPETVKREVTKSIAPLQAAIDKASKKSKKKSREEEVSKNDTVKHLVALERAMQEAAEKFDFERAIALRDEWMKIRGDGS